MPHHDVYMLRTLTAASPHCALKARDADHSKRAARMGLALTAVAVCAAALSALPVLGSLFELDRLSSLGSSGGLSLDTVVVNPSKVMGGSAALSIINGVGMSSDVTKVGGTSNPSP